MRYQRETLLELKGFILLKVFFSNVQSVFPPLIYLCFPLNENYPLIIYRVPSSLAIQLDKPSN